MATKHERFARATLHSSAQPSPKLPRTHARTCDLSYGIARRTTIPSARSALTREATSGSSYSLTSMSPMTRALSAVVQHDGLEHAESVQRFESLLAAVAGRLDAAER